MDSITLKALLELTKTHTKLSQWNVYELFCIGFERAYVQICSVLIFEYIVVDMCKNMSIRKNPKNCKNSNKSEMNSIAASYMQTSLKSFISSFRLYFSIFEILIECYSNSVAENYYVLDSSTNLIQDRQKRTNQYYIEYSNERRTISSDGYGMM